MAASRSGAGGRRGHAGECARARSRSDGHRRRWPAEAPLAPPPGSGRHRACTAGQPQDTAHGHGPRPAGAGLVPRLSGRLDAGLARRVRAVAVAGVLGALVVGLVTGAARPVEAQTVRGLVIGIDDYVELHGLAGAVNDARDIARALSAAGVEDLVVLEDAAATRERIAGEWQALLRRADPHDTLVLTYAGHGGQEPARVPGTERDGRDEVLLLGGFRSTGPGTRERIFDDELNEWFVEAGARGLRVVFVADSCHSGTLTRSIDPRVSAPALRTATYTIDDDLLELDIPEAVAALDEAALPHVSFLAAGQEHEQVPEIMLPGKAGRPEPRGALSYMFARAVEGEADVDGDGVLRRDELWRFVRENVRMMSEARQTPNLVPNTRGGESVLRLTPPPRPGAGESATELDAVAAAPMPDAAETGGAPGAGGVTGAPAATTAAGGPVERLERVRLAVMHAEPGILASMRDTLVGVRMVSIEAAPDLIWDARARHVVTGLGDVAAYDVGPVELPAVIEKWEAVRALRALSARASLRLRVLPHDGAHRRGARIEVAVEGLRAPRLTVLGLSGNGVVHYLYPLPSDPAALATDGAFRLALEVTPPFGADHIVAVSAQSSLDALNAELGRLDGRAAARRATALLSAAAAEAQGWWSGVQGLFTVP